MDTFLHSSFWGSLWGFVTSSLGLAARLPKWIKRRTLICSNTHNKHSHAHTNTRSLWEQGLMCTQTTSHAFKGTRWLCLFVRFGVLGSYQTRCMLLFDLNVTQMGENLTPNDANSQRIPWQLDNVYFFSCIYLYTCAY